MEKRRILTYEEYCRLPRVTGSTTQLIAGQVIRDPTPGLIHQRVSRRLIHLLIPYFKDTDPWGELFAAPLELFLDEYTVVQPDLLYFPSSRPAQRTPIDALPELIIEITDASTTKTDRIHKRNSYQKAQVPHYWIVDPTHYFIQCFELKSDSYAIVGAFDEYTFSHEAFPGLTFAFDELFSGLHKNQEGQ